MGCRSMPYWMGNYVYDVLFLTFMTGVFVGCCFLFDSFRGSNNTQAGFNLSLVTECAFPWIYMSFFANFAMVALVYFI